MRTQSPHPASRWKQAARQESSLQTQLRLASMAGHLHSDKIAARRAAIIDLLADGRPHPRDEIFTIIITQLQSDCWGKHRHEALARDLAALRLGGIRIAYSRKPKLIGYYLQHPPLKSSPTPTYESINWELIKAIGELSVPEKNERAFAAADFALRQKRLLLQETHPEWTAAAIDKEARQLVYGRVEEILP